MLRLLIMSLSAAVFQHWNWRGWKWQVESYLVVLGPTVASVLGLTRRRIESVCLTDTGIALRAGRPLQSVVIPWSAVDRAEVRFRWLLARLDVWLGDPAAMVAPAGEQPRAREAGRPAYSVPVGLLTPGPRRMRAELARRRPASSQ
jgi:hypothetical protein